MAKRGRTVFFSILGISAALAGFGYLQTRPRWQTATEAEVLAVIDPSLLQREMEDPAARARYDRLEVVLKGLRRQPSNSTAALLPDERAKIDAIERILDEGPLQRPLPSWDVNSLVPTSWHAIAIQVLSRAAKGEAAAGRIDSAARLLVLGLRFAYAYGDTPSTKIAILTRDVHAGMVFASLYPLLARLDEPQLREIASAIPPALVVEEGMKRAIRSEFQGLTLPQIPDPAAWNRKAHALRAQRVEVEDLIGSYDALETARQMSRALVQAMENAGRRRFEQIDTVEKRIVYLEGTLPVDQSPSATGYWVRIRKLQYRIQMAQTPNSFARLYLFVAARGQQSLMDLSFRSRASREGIHTLLALYRYRLRYGHPAPDLESLVKAQLLPRLPIDFLGRGNLRYDPKRHCLWSVGGNGIDDGGTASRPNDMKGKDLLWRTP